MPKGILCKKDGVGPLLESKIAESVTTTTQQRKQVDLLCRCWSRHENKIVTNYITSFFFARAKAADITAILADMQEKQNFPWDRLFNISTDGPNINKAIWRLLNNYLKEQGFH